MQLTHVCTAVAVTIIAAAPAWAQVPQPLQHDGLQRYVAEVLERNAGLTAAGDALGAASQRVAPAGALPDPALSLGLMAVPITSFDLEREPMSRFPIGLHQSFPFPGKQAARTVVAERERDVALTRLGLTESALAAEAAGAFFALAFARSAFRVWEGRLELARQAVRVTQSRYETGRAPQTDLLRAQLREARLSEEGHGFTAAVEAAAARADALRAGPDAALATPPLVGPEAAILDAALADTLAPFDSLIARLVARSPPLALASAEVDRARASARVFAIAARPDFTLNLSLDPRLADREPFFTAMLGISIPLWAARKQSPAARAAEFETRRAGRLYEDLRARLEGELRDQVAQLEATRRRIAELRDQVLPLAAAASASALRSYAAGAVELTAVLDAQDDLFQVQLELARLLANYGARRAALSGLLGEEWYR